MSRIAACVLILAAVQGQDVSPRKKAPPAAKTDTQPSPTLRITTDLVQVPVTVTDKLGRPVTGLEKENFRIFDNKVEQVITKFAMDDEPVAVGFVFDVSGSIGGMLRQYQLAAHEFFKVANDEDEFFLVVFESQPKLAVPLTKHANDIEYQIMMTKSRGMTALFDAVYMAANEIKKSKVGKKALILISDGGENHSRYSFGELKNALVETDALLYTIGPHPDDRRGDNDGHLLKQLAEMTGGRLIVVNGQDFADLAQKIVIDLRNRYVMYYSPTDKARDGRYHHIQVQILPPRGLPKLIPHWRTGYYAAEH
jgi:VWFA-related protein